MEMGANLLPITRCSIILSGCLYSYMGSWGALGSFAIVRGGDDESLIKSGPQCSELPDLPQAQNENSIHFSFFIWIRVPLPPFVLLFIKTVLLEDIATVCAWLIGKASNDNGCGGMRD